MKEMQSAPALRRWTRAEYERMIAAGVIHSGERVELIDGEIRTMAAHGSVHAAAIRAAQKALEAVFGEGYDVRVQLPLSLDDYAAPEPDVAVVPGSFQDYWDAHPTQALVVVEVADSSLKEDRRDKGSLYARGGIQDYWILNVSKREVEVHRDPIPDAKTRYGWKYRLVQRLGLADAIRPLAKPEAVISVASFFRPG